MLNSLSVTNFKSHDVSNVELKKITLLVGTNSGGKSSIIQALLLIIHNITNQTASPLNGHLVSIGTFTEAGNYVLNKNFFELGVTQGSEKVVMKFSQPDEGEQEPNCSIKETSEVLQEFLNYRNNRVHYLSANRIGGQDLYTKNFDKYDVFGLNGEYAVDYFENHKEDKLSEEMLSDSASVTLEYQVNFWLEKIFNQKITTSSISGTDKIKAEYRLPYTRTIRPKNTGAGISYLVSILIVCLSSQRGDLIVVENPEIHLHPKAQSILTEFFIFIANADRQLIVETHSDHLFNGIRLGINKNKILKENAAVHFFTLGDEQVTNHLPVEFNDQGQVINVTTDLFDQFSNDLKELVGF